MHTLCARVLPRCNELLCIFVCKLILVVPFFERARAGRVPVLDIKAATEANIPIVVDVVHV